MEYSDFNLVANPNGQGYIQDGVVQKYYDESLTLPIPQGTIIPTNMAFTASGRIIADFVGSLKADVVYTDVAGTPSGVSNYVKQATLKYEVVTASESLTTNPQYTYVDPENPIAVVQEITASGIQEGDKLFVKPSWAEEALYSEALTGTCLSRVEKYMD